LTSGAPVLALDHVRSSTPIFNSANEGRTSDTQSPELLLPLPGRTQLLGAIALGPKRSEAPYTPSDLRLLESVSVQTGLGLELSKRLRRWPPRQWNANASRGKWRLRAKFRSGCFRTVYRQSRA
jgi:hypothetical protein